MADYSPDERARQVVTLALHHDDAQLAATTIHADPDPSLIAAHLTGYLVAAVRDAATCREMDPADYWVLLCQRLGAT